MNTLTISQSPGASLQVLRREIDEYSREAYPNSGLSIATYPGNEVVPGPFEAVELEGYFEVPPCKGIRSAVASARIVSFRACPAGLIQSVLLELPAERSVRFVGCDLAGSGTSEFRFIHVKRCSAGGERMRLVRGRSVTVELPCSPEVWEPLVGSCETLSVDLNGSRTTDRLDAVLLARSQPLRNLYVTNSNFDLASLRVMASSTSGSLSFDRCGFLGRGPAPRAPDIRFSLRRLLLGVKGLSAVWVSCFLADIRGLEELRLPAVRFGARIALSLEGQLNLSRLWIVECSSVSPNCGVMLPQVKNLFATVAQARTLDLGRLFPNAEVTVL